MDFSQHSGEMGLAAVCDEAFGQQIVGHFRLLRLIGSGFCGNVYEAVSIRKTYQRVFELLFVFPFA